MAFSAQRHMKAIRKLHSLKTNVNNVHRVCDNGKGNFSLLAVDNKGYQGPINHRDLLCKQYRRASVRSISQVKKYELW